MLAAVFFFLRAWRWRLRFLCAARLIVRDSFIVVKYCSITGDVPSGLSLRLPLQASSCSIKL